MINFSYFGAITREMITHDLKLDHPKIWSIANSSPAWFQGGRIDELCPGQIVWDLKRGEIDHKEYTDRYQSKLFGLRSSGYDFDQLNGRILLCWEKPGKFCHRRILAEMINRWTIHDIYLDGQLMIKQKQKGEE